MFKLKSSSSRRALEEIFIPKQLKAKALLKDYWHWFIYLEQVFSAELAHWHGCQEITYELMYYSKKDTLKFYWTQHSHQPQITLRRTKFLKQSNTLTITQICHTLFYLFSYLLDRWFRVMLSFKYRNRFDWSIPHQTSRWSLNAFRQKHLTEAVSFKYMKIVQVNC